MLRSRTLWMLVTAVGGSLVALVFARVIARSQAPDAAACVADGAAQDGADLGRD